MTNGSDQMTLLESGGRPIKAWVDGACPNNGAPDAVIGCGCLIQDDTRAPTETNSQPDIGQDDCQPTNNIAEYIAVLLALAWVEEHHSTEVAVSLSTDSELVVEQLNGDADVKSSNIKDIHRETREFLYEFQDWDINYMSKDESRYIQRADELAKAAARGGKR